MPGCHAATVTRCDSRADFGACPCCGYSAAGEPFDACPCSGYSVTAGSLFDAAFPCYVFTQGSSRLLNNVGNLHTPELDTPHTQKSPREMRWQRDHANNIDHSNIAVANC